MFKGQNLFILCTKTHVFQRFIIPIPTTRNLNLPKSKALVRRSAKFFSESILTTCINLFSLQSLMKWCLISMCFVFEC
jgi:hypothetical protein